MAHAGDGERRSERRRRTVTVSLRMSVEDKRALETRAVESGYPNLSAWALDRLWQDGVGARERRVIYGLLGRHGARLSALLRNGRGRGGCDPRSEIRQLAADVLELQSHVMRGQADAGEENR
ncbi:hypothetical protein GVY41_18905 [Frigidibacter albus]|uniref:Mobilization protein n=1 Tax=Frigidibacter albus TaxID=1465486 RepID=A0A6L8VL84_9RHOB|nr:hypothetical protein [Frigidibacter albus]MZQ91118.1 hypothetical protein [Frigidibacter albus]NBE33071.1 hypothetical protein [Frigidibacter albus]GGH62873.1 hypothetical protein GCM10011341_37460 [Frigidibacter albus]